MYLDWINILKFCFKAKLIDEDKFDDLEIMPKMMTSDELKLFESKLDDEEYQQRFIRFLRTKFVLDGNQNGATTFKEIMRMLVDESSLFKPFSWGGQKRSGMTNESFKLTHTVFITFMKKNGSIG